MFTIQFIFLSFLKLSAPLETLLKFTSYFTLGPKILTFYISSQTIGWLEQGLLSVVRVTSLKKQYLDTKSDKCEVRGEF